MAAAILEFTAIAHFSSSPSSASNAERTQPSGSLFQIESCRSTRSIWVASSLAGRPVRANSGCVSPSLTSQCHHRHNTQRIEAARGVITGRSYVLSSTLVAEEGKVEEVMKLCKGILAWADERKLTESPSLNVSWSTSASLRPVTRVTCQTRIAEAAGPSLAQQDEWREGARELDDQLSNRPLDLDPCGYFLIRVDPQRGEIVAEHYGNLINAEGMACDPETGEVIPCDGSYRPTLLQTYRGLTAKELSVSIIEQPLGSSSSLPISLLSHANYLGREFQKAERALLDGVPYIQD
eukprot:TRINITY_DN72_c0_g1_i1.p1 TRINITY_DN72_c0_g1~~TRINITY_DN72_c0_g1_i1.p1  ORF type:complete len:303 (+),score=19.40 TRINITY_DN72_c0_g1_i1:30-911(+)